MAIIAWRMLLLQAVRLPRSLAPAKTGSNMEARIAMMAITTSSSIRVNARKGPGCFSRGRTVLGRQFTDFGFTRLGYRPPFHLGNRSFGGWSFQGPGQTIYD